MSDENLEAESLDASTSTETLDATPEATPETAAPEADEAESSPAEGEKPSLLSVVRKVTQKPAAAASPAGNDDTKDKDQPGEADDEDYSDVPFNKHPRFQKLIQQRNELRPDAERYRNLTAFMSQSGVSHEEAADALITAGLLKSDPAEAWKRLEPIAKDLLLRIGRLLPDDLRQQVEAGRLTREQAQALAAERAKYTQLQGRVDHDTRIAEQRRQEQERAAQAAHVRSLTDAAAAWEAAKAGDPRAEFAKKSEALQMRVLWLQRTEGQPKDAEGVRKQLDDAWRYVSGLPQFKPAAPKPGITPVTGGRASGATQSPKPQSLLEVVQQARAG